MAVNQRRESPVSPTWDRPENENDPLLPKRNKKHLRSHFVAHLDRSGTDIVLLLNYIITGLLDSSATVIWGVFTSMQTGNSIYVGLGIANPNSSKRWIKSALSIASFCLGSFMFSRLHRAWGEDRQRRRAVVAGSFFLQLILIVFAALVVHFTTKPGLDDEDELKWHELVSIASIAIQSSGQTSTSRALEFGFLTSTVLTTIYCDLFSDQNLFAGFRANADRNRRAFAPLLLLAGAVLGGKWARSDFGLEGALWTAALLKGGTVVACLFWKEERETG